MRDGLDAANFSRLRDSDRVAVLGLSDFSEKLYGMFALRVLNDLTWRTDLFDRALADESDTVRYVTRKSDFMGHHEHRHSLVAQKTQGVENLANEFGVECRCDFIEKHVVRFHRERAGNRETLLLTTGHLVRVDIELVRQANMLELLAGYFTCLLPGLAHDDSGSQSHVFESRQMRKGIPLLEHHADFPAQLVDVCFLCVNIRPIDKDLTALDRLERVDAIKQRRFARSTGSKNADHFAFFNGQADPLQDMQGPKGFMDVIDFNHLATCVPVFP